MKAGIEVQTFSSVEAINGELIPVKGTLTVDVDYGDQHFVNLDLLVVEGSGPSLMGRDWLKIINLDWKGIRKVSSQDLETQVTNIQNKYKDVFTEALGTITPFFAKLNVSSDAKPKFFRPQLVPFALKEGVENELD